MTEVNKEVSKKINNFQNIADEIKNYRNKLKILFQKYYLKIKLIVKIDILEGMNILILL